VSADLHTSATSDPLARQRAYKLVVERIRQLVADHVPPGATVVVVSRGDPELVTLPGRPAWHFPRDEEGRYAGYHPATSDDAIEQLEAVREAGGDYLVFPRTAFWWLDHYREFRRHLESRYPISLRDDACLMYQLRRRAECTALVAAEGARHRAALRGQQIAQMVESLLLDDAVVILFLVEHDSPPLASRPVRRLTPLPTAVPGASQDDHLIADLERLRAGADYLVVPSDALDWLLSHPVVRDHIADSCRQVALQRHVCAMFDLRPRSGSP
jgi:hypothetical protein